MGEERNRFDVLGVQIDDIDPSRALARLEELVAGAGPGYFVFCTVSTVVASRDDIDLRRALDEATVVTPDGMPLVWLGKRAGYKTERVYGPDFLLEVLEKTGSRYRHFFYGGAPGVAEKMADRLKARFPEIQIAGVATPPFGAAIEDADGWHLSEIAATSPDIVWIGLGHPRQEKWMRLHHRDLGAPVAAGVGAAFDFLSGEKKEAPDWMKQSGLQWAHRLADEPSRLWRRYLIGNTVFVARLLRDHLGKRRSK